MAKLLFDENLSPALVKILAAQFPESESVIPLGLRSDREIWAYAKELEMIVATKDTDFIPMSAMTGLTPKVVFIRLGNTTTKAIAMLLSSNSDLIDEFSQSQATLLEIP